MEGQRLPDLSWRIRVAWRTYGGVREGEATYTVVASDAVEAHRLAMNRARRRHRCSFIATQIGVPIACAGEAGNTAR